MVTLVKGGFTNPFQSSTILNDLHILTLILGNHQQEPIRTRNETTRQHCIPISIQFPTPAAYTFVPTNPQVNFLSFSILPNERLSCRLLDLAVMAIRRHESESSLLAKPTAILAFARARRGNPSWPQPRPSPSFAWNRLETRRGENHLQIPSRLVVSQCSFQSSPTTWLLGFGVIGKHVHE